MLLLTLYFCAFHLGFGSVVMAGVSGARHYLGRRQLSVQTAHGEKLVVGSLLDEPTFIEHQDRISIADGG